MSRITDFTDDFARADAANLGANWDAGHTVVGGTITFDPIAIVSQKTEVTAIAGAGSMESVNTISLVDMWASVRIASLAGGAGHVQIINAMFGLSAPGGPLSAYSVQVSRAGSTYQASIRRWDDATGDIAIGSTDSSAWAATDLLSGERIGTTINLYRNFTEGMTPLLSTTDATYTSAGRAALYLYLSGTVDRTELEGDDFTCGHFGAQRSFLLVRR